MEQGAGGSWVERVKGDAHQGQYALRLVSRRSRQVFRSERFSVASRGQLFISFYARSKGRDRGYGLNVSGLKIDAEYYDDRGSLIPNRSGSADFHTTFRLPYAYTLAGDFNWKFFSYCLPLPRAAVTANLIITSGQDRSNVFIDDIFVTGLDLK